MSKLVYTDVTDYLADFDYEYPNYIEMKENSDTVLIKNIWNHRGFPGGYLMIGITKRTIKNKKYRHVWICDEDDGLITKVFPSVYECQQEILRLRRTAPIDMYELAKEHGYDW